MDAECSEVFTAALLPPVPALVFPQGFKFSCHELSTREVSASAPAAGGGGGRGSGSSGGREGQAESRWLLSTQGEDPAAVVDVRRGRRWDTLHATAGRLCVASQALLPLHVVFASSSLASTQTPGGLAGSTTRDRRGPQGASRKWCVPVRAHAC